MAGLRSYGDPCGIARALDIVGERWALLIIRELMLGPKRFTDVRRGLPGASPNVISQRLRELESAGVVRRLRVGGARYELTEWGRTLRPVLIGLGQWGARSGTPPKSPMSPDALMLALESTFIAERMNSLDIRIELRLDDEPFTAELRSDRLQVSRGAPFDADARIEGATSDLRAVVFGDRGIEESGITLEGDTAVARRFLGSFERPSPITS